MYKKILFSLLWASVLWILTSLPASASSPFPLGINMLHNQILRQETINAKNYQHWIIKKNRSHLDWLRKKRERLKSSFRKKSIKNTLLFPAPAQEKKTHSFSYKPKFAKVKKQNMAHQKKKIQQRYQHTVSNVRNVDINRVQNTWLSWNNSLRKKKWLHPYTLRNELNKTALEWSKFSKQRGYIIHGRPWDGCVGKYNYGCYNFPVIDKWFKKRGINPKIVARSKHTENIGWGYYKCNSSDCTDALIKSIRKTYDFFYRERSYNGVHYRSLVHNHFKSIGLGVTVDPTKKRYYLTVHYANEF